MKSTILFGGALMIGITAIVYHLGASGRHDASRWQLKGSVTKYGELFMQIDSLMASNSYEHVHKWPLSKNAIATSMTNEIPDTDYNYYFSGSYEARDYGFLKVIVRHRTGNADFTGQWPSLPHRQNEIHEIEQSIRQLVTAYTERTAGKQGVRHPVSSDIGNKK